MNRGKTASLTTSLLLNEYHPPTFNHLMFTIILFCIINFLL